MPRVVGKLEDRAHYPVRMLDRSVYRTNPYVVRPPPELPKAIRLELLRQEAFTLEELLTVGSAIAVHPLPTLLLLSLLTRSIVAGFRSTTGAALVMKLVTLVLVSMLVPVLVTLLPQKLAIQLRVLATVLSLTAYPARLLLESVVFVEQVHGRTLTK